MLFPYNLQIFYDAGQLNVKNSVNIRPYCNNRMVMCFKTVEWYYGIWFCSDVNRQRNVDKLQKICNNAEIMQNCVGINEERVMNGLTGSETCARNIITLRQCAAVGTHGECVM
jgi:hypothetical protein